MQIENHSMHEKLLKRFLASYWSRRFKTKFLLSRSTTTSRTIVTFITIKLRIRQIYLVSKKHKKKREGNE